MSPSSPSSFRASGLIVLIALLFVSFGCEREETSPEVIARLGEAHLTLDELTDMMPSTLVGQDSVEMQEQLIEQWMTNELLHQEALRRGLQEDDDVKRLLEENERTILINALVSNVYEEEIEAPSSSEIQSYYERHREQLRLHAPYVHVRYLSTSNQEDAESARTALAEASSPAEADSLWPNIIDTYASDREGSMNLSQNFYPEAQLFRSEPMLQNSLQQLQSGELAPVIASDNGYHVLQLLDRVAAGTVPEQAWVEDEIRRRLIIQARKQMVARHVQRLRTEALSQGNLETP